MTVLLALRVIAGCILLGLGVAVLIRRPRPTSAVAFAAFGVGLGALYLRPVFGVPSGMGAYAITANIVILLGFWTMFLVFPTPLRRKEVPLLGAAFAAGLLGTSFEYGPILLRAAASGDAGFVALTGFAFMSSIGILTGVVLFPLRARRLAPGETSAARSLAIFSVGVALFRGFDAVDIIGAARGDIPFAALVDAALVLGLPAVLWIAVIVRGAHPRLARNTVLAHMAVVVAALLLSRLDVNTILLGLAGALLLGFAILRGQIDGLDVKVRFAVSRSTIAAVFIAVFFVASEAAQQFFGDQFESGYLGIFAAGALVFAIAPLSRVADRLAERAVPMAVPVEAPAPGSKSEEAYRRTVRLAWKDRALTPEEEVHLFHVAEALGVTAGRAMEIRHEVERDARRKEVSS